jgi:trehalose-phosphatase
MEVIRAYTEHTDGSWIEDKEFAIVWHFENADPEYGRMQASELVKYLNKVLGHIEIDVIKYDYNRIVEVKPHGISKGRAATHILRTVLGKAKQMGQNVQSPFLMCIGDDLSDEEMFRAVQKRDDKQPEVKTSAVVSAASASAHRRKPSLPGEEKERETLGREQRDKKFDPNTFTLCVGIKPSNARFYLHDHEDVAKLLQALATCSERMGSAKRRTGGLASILAGSEASQLNAGNQAQTGLAPNSNNSSSNNVNFMSQSSPASMPVVTMQRSQQHQREQKASASSQQISQSAQQTKTADNSPKTSTTVLPDVKHSGSIPSSSSQSLLSSKRQAAAAKQEPIEAEQSEADEEPDEAEDLSLNSKGKKGKAYTNLAELAS